ncbi:hypothetical protein KIN20_032937 [Parelaphostrongylus tenuis]|uniref:Uncharacterized protein n=1 Tax=Parelaphostrongylus tenuis TaxID=148309 RepID=A0AAD5R7R6_PARTN|nr:hypothetical protein KIN20_032937 [Parelaphostrongylus tenuis]
MPSQEVAFPPHSDMSFRETAFMFYLEDVVQRRPAQYSWGDVSFEFALIFKHFIERTADHFQELSSRPLSPSDLYEITRVYHFIIGKIRSFADFPFTWLRFCELLHDPSRHYRRLMPFMHALERVINVHTTITSNNRPAVDLIISSEPIIFKIDANTGKLLAVEEHSIQLVTESDVSSFGDTCGFPSPTSSLLDYSDDEVTEASMFDDFDASYLLSDIDDAPPQGAHTDSHCECGNCS